MKNNKYSKKSPSPTDDRYQTSKNTISPTNKEDDFSSIDPSLVKDLLRSEESEVNNNIYQGNNDDNDEEELSQNQIDENQEYINNNNEEEEEAEENYNHKFTGEIVHIEDEENDYEEEDEKKETSNDNIQTNNESPMKKRKQKYNQHGMERISEVENEDEKYNNTMFDKINEEALKEEYRLNDKNFDELLRSNVNSKNIKNLFQPTLYNTEENNYNYKPEINKNSKLIANDKERERERNKSSDNNTTQRSKSPIELELYKDAIKRREKLQKLEYNHMMAILLDSSKTKISNNSHRIAINKVEKVIEASVEYRDKDKSKTLTFIDLGMILTDLKIFRELFPKEDPQDKNNKKYQSYKDIKLELKSTKEQEKRKKAEIDFYEQLWMVLNPDNKELIRSDVFSEFLKILFSPIASSVKEISAILKQFLLAAFFLNSNPDENKTYISPITEKNISEEDVWPLDKVVKEFLSLKENILAYQGTKNYSLKLKQDLEKYKKEQLNFKPNIAKENKDFKSRSNFFNERLPALLDRDKLRRQVLDEMKKEQEESLLRECTFKPKVNKKLFVSDENLENEGPVYEKLYSIYKEKLEKNKKLREEHQISQASKELIGCTFKPELISKHRTLENSLSSTDKPKGYQQTINRLRNGILENFKKKYLIDKIPIGENYEKIKRANIKPFNITDMRKNQSINNQEEETIDEDYFSIQITIPSGKERTLRVHKDDDPYEIADEFCKIYGMKNEIKQRLANTILKFMTLYLTKRHDKSEEDFLSTNQQLVTDNIITQDNLNLDD